MATHLDRKVGRRLGGEALIPKRIKHVLAAPRPPTAPDLRELGWQDTNSMGVYAWILKSKFINPLKPKSFIYVGFGYQVWLGSVLKESSTPKRKRRE